MRKLYILILISGIFFAQCSKKTTDGMASKAETTVKDPNLAWRSKAPGAGAARPIELGEYSSFDMPNGLKVIVVENHKLPRVSYQLSLLNDPIVEGDQAGYVSFAGDLLATGTKNMSKAEIDAAVDFIGGSLNSSSGGVFANSLKKHSGKLLELMTDVLFNPSFPQAEFDKLRTQSLSGLATAKTDANAISGNLASVLNYGKNHPYGEVQTEETVKNISLDKCKSYYNTYFKPNNAYLVIVGDVTQEEAKMTAEKYFGSWKSGVLPENKYANPAEVEGTHVSFGNKDGAVQSVIRITYPVFLEPGAPDAIKASVMNNILGGGIFSGRLMQNLREDKAYTYGARSSLSTDELVGNFNAGASVRNEVTDSSVTEFLYEMKRLVDEPVSADDLQLVKNSMTGSFARSLESPQTIAGFARNTYRFNLPKDYYQTYLQKLNAVTVADVQAMAKKYIRPDRAHIIVVGSKDDVAHKLTKFDADGKVDFYDAFGNLLEDDAAAALDGIDGATVISDYISSIGGKDKLMGVKSLMTKMTMDIMGQQASVEQGSKDNKMFYMEMSMGGSILQEQRFDGVKGKVAGMGQSQIVTEGNEYDQMKEAAVAFGQLNYLTDGTSLNIKGIEDINGKKAYKVEVIKASGKKNYEYYDMTSNLLVRTLEVEEAPEGQEPQSMVTDISDYKEVNGIMLPHTITITGAMPFPLTMKADAYMINSDIPSDKFKVD